jgi:ClpP class serine protease
MTNLPYVASRVFGVPLLMDPKRLDTMLSAIGYRIGLAPSPMADGGREDLAQDDDSPRMSRGCEITPHGVAVVPIVGTLVARGGRIMADCTELRSYARIKADLMAAMHSPKVRGVVPDIDSGGGEVANCLELSRDIAALRGRGKRIIAVANTAAFSAAYALACAADAIFIPQSGGVGSVGVVAVHVDVSGEDKQKGHRYTYVAAGARKLDGNPHAPLTDTAEAVIAAEVERLYGLFVDLVAANRPSLSARAIRGTEAGLLFGEDAIKAKADTGGVSAEAARDARLAIIRAGRHHEIHRHHRHIRGISQPSQRLLHRHLVVWHNAGGWVKRKIPCANTCAITRASTIANTIAFAITNTSVITSVIAFASTSVITCVIAFASTRAFAITITSVNTSANTTIITSAITSVITSAITKFFDC